MSDRFQDDQLLITRAQQGDRASLNALVRKYEVRAYQYAFRLTRNPEEAADIVAEGFVRVHNAIRNFKGNAAFTTWLYRILTNCFLDLRKKEKNRQATSLDALMQTPEGEFERQIEDPGIGPGNEAEKAARERTIQIAVNKLPDFQKALIVMYHAEMKSYEEISEALDLPIGTVKSRLNRARLSLREMLVKDEELFRI
jgi:RNA polymerase sigma-70 factor, ECF subfamily